MMTNEKYQFQSFLKYKNIAYGISSKACGSMKKNSADTNREALSQFAGSFGITDNVVCMRQIHSGNVTIIDDASDLQISETDSLLTDKKHIPLAVLTADCLPLLFYDPKKNVIAATHAGYKGLLNHIIENTIHRFISDFKSDPKNIIVGIGPSIERDCYEVGEERIEKFKKVYPKFKKIYKEQDGKFYLDLRSIARQCLVKEGILEEHIEIMNICTKCDPNFYSYRGGDGNNRFVSIISLIKS